MNIDYTEIIGGIITIISAIVTTFLIPYLKEKLSQEKLQKLSYWVKIACQAAEQGRDVFVIPGNIDNPACAGSNQLLRDGAIPVSCGWDILSEYESLYPGKIRKTDPSAKPENRDFRRLSWEEKPTLSQKKEEKWTDIRTTHNLRRRGASRSS